MDRAGSRASKSQTSRLHPRMGYREVEVLLDRQHSRPGTASDRSDHADHEDRSGHSDKLINKYGWLVDRYVPSSSSRRHLKLDYRRDHPANRLKNARERVGDAHWSNRYKSLDGKETEEDDGWLLNYDDEAGSYASSSLRYGTDDTRSSRPSSTMQEQVLPLRQKVDRSSNSAASEAQPDGHISAQLPAHSDDTQKEVLPGLRTLTTDSKTHSDRNDSTRLTSSKFSRAKLAAARAR